MLLICLLAADLVLLAERGRLKDRVREVDRRSAVARIKASYAREEERLLVDVGKLPATFPLAAAQPQHPDAVRFVLLVSVDDCTNCIEDELLMLNEMVAEGSARVAGIQGFFVDVDRPSVVRAMAQRLAPQPAFPVATQNAIAHLPGAHTPLVLAVRAGDGRILDAHKPIPEDLSKRDAFYARWRALLR